MRGKLVDGEGGAGLHTCGGEVGDKLLSSDFVAVVFERFEFLPEGCPCAEDGLGGKSRLFLAKAEAMWLVRLGSAYSVLVHNGRSCQTLLGLHSLRVTGVAAVAHCFIDCHPSSF